MESNKWARSGCQPSNGGQKIRYKGKFYSECKEEFDVFSDKIFSGEIPSTTGDQRARTGALEVALQSGTLPVKTRGGGG